MKLQIIISVVVIMFCSCINKKYLAKNQVVFRVEKAYNNKTKITAYYTGNKKVRVKLQDADGQLFILPDTAKAPGFTLPTIVVCQFDTTGKYGQLYKNNAYYYPEIQYPIAWDINSNNSFKCPPRLRYSENHPVVQIVTVPLKVRQAILYRRFKDSLPTQALAELNLGAAVGFKRTWTSFKAQPTEEGVTTVHTSFACTGFVTLGGTNVKPLTTQNAVPYEKTEYAVSSGINILFGYNNLNLGISFGTDHLLNQSLAKKWIFDGKIWYGIALAYDIFK